MHIAIMHWFASNFYPLMVMATKQAICLAVRYSRTNSARHKKFTFDTTRSIRSLYNEAAKRAGLNEKISGHRYGKYHFKIYKKRWFSEAIKAGVPEYIVMGMLGRKKYLDQYMALTR